MVAIIAIVALVLAIVCMCVESRVTGTFKAFNVYGRITAYFGLFAPMGFIMFIVSFFVDGFADQRWIMLGLGIFGCIFYAIAFYNCPAFLRKKVIFCMFISGMGVAFKLCLFFIGAMWTIMGPQEMQDESGNTVYVYDGEVYTGSGEHIGTASADRTSYVRIKE